MSESLPLIPDKGGAVCADVRPVLRAVFQRLDHLPPLAPHRTPRAPAHIHTDARLPAINDQWIDKYESDREEVRRREGELKQQYAARLARGPLSNVYRLRPPHSTGTGGAHPSWRGDRPGIDRRDLMPTPQQCDAEGTLWVNNILTRSSGDVSSMVVRGMKVDSPVCLGAPREGSLQSVSYGELPPPASELRAARVPPPSAPIHVLCVPPAVDFVNFTVGHLHTQAVRLMNVSKFELRLSVRPPRSTTLDVELAGPRGLALSSGASTEIKLHFRPRDVRVLRDVLAVRVSSGQLLDVPITCYMQPPLLHILVPAVAPAGVASSGGAALARSLDCLELGARLLGDVHCVPVLLHCEADHAAFFLLTEDAWLDFSLDVVSARGSLVAGAFVVWPAWWRGGGAVRACVWCHALTAGLHEAPLRVLSTTAVVRPLHLIADALFFRPDHITLQAQSKDYDICSDDDPACEYYVHLGTAFPRRSLSATVHLLNHSPVVYQYYWSVRPWGECSCWAEERQERREREERKREEREEREQEGEERSEGASSRLCSGAREAWEKELTEGRVEGEGEVTSSAGRLRVEAARGAVAARSSCAVHVRVPDVGDTLGVQRAVLMLILKGIPKESLPDNYDPMIVRTEVVDSDPMPGVKHWSREVCDVVCAQLEVWWEVAPVRFVLDPHHLHLEHSRRVHEVEIVVRATQLFGSDGVSCTWRAPPHVHAPAAPLALAAAHSCAATLRYTLPALPNHFPKTDIITLEAAQAEWQASGEVQRHCATRHPGLRPAACWLGLVPPAAGLTTNLHLHNDTYQHICWWANVFRWMGERGTGAACDTLVCARCQDHSCTCDIIRPSRGALLHQHTQDIAYSVTAPEHDGVVATLVTVQRTSADVARVASGAGSEARAALLAYRVLAPRLVLRALPCHGDKHAGCAGCALEAGARGAAVLRPRAALPLGQASCYRLRFTNTTPLPTSVTWDPPLEEEYLQVEFYPNQFEVAGYATVDIQVVLRTRRVCGRRLFLRRARATYTHQPIYLVIDAAISGLEIVCEVPVGGGRNTETTLVMRRTQCEVYPWETGPRVPDTFHEIFAEEDRKRAVRAENLCGCKNKTMYVPPPPARPRPSPQNDDDYPPIEIVWSPPPWSRVCACGACAAPLVAAPPEGLCLQFHATPLRTVCRRRVVIRNESPLPAAWSAAVRRWPRRHTRTLHEDQWAGDVCAAGACLEVRPGGGTLLPRGSLLLTLAVYVDCWGHYRDQLAIKIENLEAIVLDVWIEAVGSPLQFALSVDELRAPVLCWTSAAQGGRARARTLRVKNVSRAELLVHAYLCVQHDRPQQELPFRLYYRLHDEPPPSCPCLNGPEEELAAGSSSCRSSEEQYTGLELYLGPDVGSQTHEHFTVSPESMSLPPGEWGTWRVELASGRPELVPSSALLLRPLPAHTAGAGWARGAPGARLVRMSVAACEPRLRTSHRELRVRLCALRLPPGDVLRVRKRFLVQNVGGAPLEVGARTEPPWSLVGGGGHCGCEGQGGVHRARDTSLLLMPRSSMEMCVEVRVNTAEVTPAVGAPSALAPAPAPAPEPPYPPHQETRTSLHFYDEDNVLKVDVLFLYHDHQSKTMSLVLELEYPVLTMEPTSIDFGFVTDGDTRKSYYSIAHSSRSEVLELRAEWEGGAGFRLHPRSFTLQPGERGRVYVLYTAEWCGAPVPVEGRVVVRAAGCAGAWCACACAARAAPARDLARCAPPADLTDDACLTPAPRALPAPSCL